MTTPRKRLGIFGWGIVAPRSPDVAAFESNLEHAESWLVPFDGFGPNNFLVGEPEFDFARYKPWIDGRFEPRMSARLQVKMGWVAGKINMGIGRVHACVISWLWE